MRPSFYGNASFNLWQHSENVHNEFEIWFLHNEYKFRKMIFAQWIQKNKKRILHNEYKNVKNKFCTMNSKNDLHDIMS